METYKIYSDYLSVSRLSKTLSIEELAKRIGIHKNSIYLYEQGKKTPNLKIALAFARELNMSLDALKNLEDLTKYVESLKEKVISLYPNRKSKYKENFYTVQDIATKLGKSPNVIRKWAKTGKLEPDYIDPITKARLYFKNRIDDLFTLNNYIIEDKKILVYSSNISMYDVLHLKLNLFKLDIEYDFERFIERMNEDFDGILILNKTDLKKFKEFLCQSVVNGMK